jgi:peptidoglycan/LPS O-acetylase OafA/YrhL
VSQDVSVQVGSPEPGAGVPGHAVSPDRVSPGRVSRDRDSPDRVSAGRLAWLDALRGVAVLFVVFDHLSTHVLRGPRHVITPWFDTGTYGVMVFFLVSGYIVPASLERRGSVRRFWVSRVFRLYPMWAVAVAAVLTLAVLGVAGLRGADQHPASSALAHALMLQDLLGIRDAVNVLWTLSYEMAFYLLITFLFVVRAHRRSAGFANGFAVAALAVGGILPAQALTGGDLSTRVVIIITAAAIVAGLAAAVSGRQRMRLAGAVLVGATALLLVTLNGRAWGFESFSILAWMFTGTVVYRAERGEITKAVAAATAGLVLVLTVASGVWNAAQWGGSQWVFQRSWAATYLLAAATFALAMVFWRRRAPRFLAWVGLVSYSAYLLHPLLLDVFFGVPWTRDRDFTGAAGVALAAAFMACLLGCCWLAYRFIEAPAQRLGRRLAAWLDGRLGPDAVSPGLAPPR